MIDYTEVPSSFLDVKLPVKKDFNKLNEELNSLFKNDLLKKSALLTYEITDYSEYANIFCNLLKEFYFSTAANKDHEKNINDLCIQLKNVLTMEKDNKLENFLISLLSSSIKLLQIIYEKNHHHTV